MKRNIFYAAVFAAIIFMLISSGAVIGYSCEALEMCFRYIIPTLFPFFVMSGLLIYSGFGSVLARAASPVMLPLFNVAPAGAAAFAAGLISGFPLGAATAADLYRAGSLSKTEAERLMAFSSNSGPLFIIGSVGAAIYCRPVYGVLLYVIHILSSLLVGIIFSRWGRARHNSPPMRLITRDIPLAEVFSTSLSRAAQSILTVCFSIIFFSALSRALLDLLPLPPVLSAIASGICEFSTGTIMTSQLDIPTAEKLVLTSFIVGFSGLCVHIQVVAMTADAGLSLAPYIIGKLLHGVISAALTFAALCLMPLDAPAFSAAAPASASFAWSPVIIIAAAVPVLLIAAKWLCRETPGAGVKK